MKIPWQNKYTDDKGYQVFVTDTREFTDIVTPGDTVEIDHKQYRIAEIITRKNQFGIDYPIVGLRVVEVPNEVSQEASNH